MFIEDVSKNIMKNYLKFVNFHEQNRDNWLYTICVNPLLHSLSNLKPI
jgi:hypothetical protein